MKTYVVKPQLIVALALVALLAGACSLLDKADDVNFDATLDETIVVNETDEDSEVVYAKTIVLDAASDPDINKYKDKIDAFTIKKVSYQVTSFTGDNTVFSGTLSFGDASTSTPTIAATITNLNLQQAYSSGQVFDLAVNQTDVDKIETLLKDDKAVKLYLDGFLSSTPVSSSIKVILEVTVKADAL